MRNRKHARGLSLLLCAVLLAGQLGTTIYAEGTASDTAEEPDVPHIFFSY